MSKITIAYAAADEALAQRLARDLQANDYDLVPLSARATLIAVVSATQDSELTATIEQARALGSKMIVIQAAPGAQSPVGDASIVDMSMGYDLSALEKVLGADVRARNLRFGLWFGGGIFVLFLLYTVAIVMFDVEAPAEEFQRLYTRDAATVNAFAQEYIPRSTGQAAQFEATLENFPNRDLATVVVATATQAAADGGFTPIPTGQVIAEPELSEVRQTATGGAVLRGTQTAQASLSDEEIGATATSAAATANAELADQQLTVTAAAGG